MSALRLFQLHRKASLGVRVAKLVKSEYVGVLITAVSAGRLALAGSTDQLETLTVWLPDRPRVSVRTRGDRTFWEVPSDEVVELFRQIDPGSTELHVLCQQVADFYGVGRTTSLIRNFLAGCVRDAREPRLAGRSTEHAGPLSLAVEVVAATRGLSIERVVPPDALAYADRLAHPVRKRYARVALTAWAAAKPLPRPTNENESIVADRLERWGVS